jgi:hypothetical protein
MGRETWWECWTMTTKEARLQADQREMRRCMHQQRPQSHGVIMCEASESGLMGPLNHFSEVLCMKHYFSEVHAYVYLEKSFRIFYIKSADEEEDVPRDGDTLKDRYLLYEWVRRYSDSLLHDVRSIKLSHETYEREQ